MYMSEVKYLKKIGNLYAKSHYLLNLKRLTNRKNFLHAKFKILYCRYFIVLYHVPYVIVYMLTTNFVLD